MLATYDFASDDAVERYLAAADRAYQHWRVRRPEGRGEEMAAATLAAVAAFYSDGHYVQASEP